jgi:carbamoyl-phosphate synthase large subunit
MRIMMSAAGSVVAPGIIRHLQKLGHFVIGHDCEPHGAGAGMCDEFHRSPRTEDAWRYSCFLGTREHDLYLPFLDEELRLFANPTYGIPAKAICSKQGTLTAFTNKMIQHSLLRERGFITPRATIDGDLIVKPAFGRGGRGIFRTKDAHIALRLRDAGDYLLQEFIDGIEYTVDVLADLNGGFLFAVPRMRLQANGVSTIGQVTMDEEIIELAKQIVKSFSFRGPINIQIIRERETGDLFVIEVNPRLSGSCMFTVLAGFDILNATIRLAFGLPFVPPARVEEIMARRYYVEERV